MFISSILAISVRYACINLLSLPKQDVAETYSTEEKPSVWWQDLDDELDHYITYGEQLQKDLRSWRLAQCNCEVIPASGSCIFWEWTGHKCYDTIVVSTAYKIHKKLG